MSELKGTSSPTLLNRKWGYIAILCGLPFFFLFAVLRDEPGKGRAAGICVAVIVTAARARWNLKVYPWFWLTLAAMCVLNAPLVLLVPWTSKSYPGITLLPVAIADYAIAYGFIKLAEKVARRLD